MSSPQIEILQKKCLVRNDFFAVQPIWSESVLWEEVGGRKEGAGSVVQILEDL